MTIRHHTKGFITTTGIYCLVWLLILAGCITASAQQNRKALLIGISNYDTATGWIALHSYNDLALIQKTLLKSGFTEDQIILLQDSSATKPGIIKAIDEFLIRDAQPGMHIYLHFSGHGQSIQDFNGDEPDGYDESLVSWNAHLKYVKGKYEGQNHLIDDELSVILNRLRRKIGPSGSVLCTIDACYSGGISRGQSALVRGGARPLASPGYAFTTKDGEKEQFETNPDGDVPMAGLTILTASRPYQQAIEDGITQTGVFTKAFASSLLKSTGSLNYRQLFEMIRLEMASGSQDPTLEGNPDYPVFGSHTTPAVRFFPVHRAVSDTVFEMETGTIAGFTPGSVVGLYQGVPGDTANQNFVADAVISKASSFSSEMKSPIRIEKAVRTKLWGYLKQGFCNAESLSLSLNIRNEKVKQQLRQELTNRKPALLSDQTAPYILTDSIIGTRYILSLDQVNGPNLLTETYNAPPGMEQIKALAYSIQSLSRQWIASENILKTALSSPEIKPRLMVIPLTNRDNKTNANKLVTDLYPADQIRFRVINQGRMRCFYSIINVFSNKQIEVLIPEPGQLAENFYIEPYGEDTVSRAFELVEPYGKETYILVCSSEPLDLRQQIERLKETTRSAGSSGDGMNPLLSSATPVSGMRGSSKPLKISTSTTFINICNPKH